MTEYVCGLCERGTEAAYLCPGCTAGTLERLDRFPRLYVALAAFLQPGGRGTQPGSVKAVEAPLPLAEAPFNLRGPGGIVGVLEDWRSAMQADRGWSEPVIAGDTGRRITTAARGLSLNLEWIAASWPLAGEFAREIRDLHSAAASVIGPPEPSRRLGYCTTPVDGGPCGAVVRLPAGASTTTCRWCGTNWVPTDWGRLAAGQRQFEMEEAS